MRVPGTIVTVRHLGGVYGTQQQPPEHEELVRELKLLRERGIWRLRRLSLPALDAAARAARLATEPDDARAIELLLRRAVDTLGDEEPGQAAPYLFGLVQGTAGRRPTDLRERAARCYGLSPETFREEPERLLIDRPTTPLTRSTGRARRRQ